MSLAGNCFCKILQLCVYVYVYIYTCCSLPVNRVVFLRPAGGGQFLGSGNHRPLFSTMRLVSTRLVIGCMPKMHVFWWANFYSRVLPPQSTELNRKNCALTWTTTDRF